ncbi:MAG: hypothetical protein ACRDYA_02440 [Egibacteraceae bacterium]
MRLAPAAFARTAAAPAAATAPISHGGDIVGSLLALLDLVDKPLGGG